MKSVLAARTRVVVGDPGGQNVCLCKPDRASQICLLRCLGAEEKGSHRCRLGTGFFPVLSKFKMTMGRTDATSGLGEPTVFA